VALADTAEPAPRALLFDLDGTLTDNFEGIANCIRYALTHLGVPHPDPDALRACVGPPLRETLPRLLGRDDTATTERAIALYRERFSALGWRENAVYEGVPDMLAAAALVSPRVYLCTTKPQVYAERIVAHFGLAGFLAGVYGTSLDGRFDDKADLLAHLLASERLEGRHCLMIGDRRHDMRAAQRNGARTLGVLWGYGSRSELTEAGAEALLAAPEDFSRALAQLQAASSWYA
jgi:phosphoglycolate phosphatase